MANWANPTLTSTYTNFVTEVKDRDVEVALWFEGASPTNLPTNAKRLNTSIGRFEKWNGSAWVDAAATFTFPAISVATTLAVTGAATFGSTVALAADPTTALQAATKQYVDNGLTPKANLASPTFTGTVTAAALTATGQVTFSSTGAAVLNKGTTAQRPTPVSGMLRFNTTDNKFEGYNGTAWGSIGGGATGGGSDDIFYENGQTVTTSYSITSGKNAMSAGPVTIASGVTVTVPSGSTWVVI